MDETQIMHKIEENAIEIVCACKTKKKQDGMKSSILLHFFLSQLMTQAVVKFNVRKKCPLQHQRTGASISASVGFRSICIGPEVVVVALCNAARAFKIC